MGQLSLTGTLSAGPPAGAEAFPGSNMQVPLALLAGASTTYGVASGILTQNVASPSPAYLTLSAVGASGPVTQGLFLYLKTSDSMLLEVTHDDGSGGTLVRLVPVRGLFILEFPTNMPLEGLRIQGSGRIEYFVAGQT